MKLQPLLVASSIFITVAAFALTATLPQAAAYAASQVCFCHNLDHNPHTICTSAQGLANGHMKHVEKGKDSLGACVAEPTPTPSPTPSPTPTGTPSPFPTPTPTPVPITPPVSPSPDPSPIVGNLILQSNNCHVWNKIKIITHTGNNSANNNTGSDTGIGTGNSDTNVNVTNHGCGNYLLINLGNFPNVSASIVGNGAGSQNSILNSPKKLI